MSNEKRREFERIAIVGMACRFPGGANTPEQFWSDLIQSKDAIRDIPPQRWDMQAHYHPDFTRPGKMILGKGGFVEEIDYFDPQFFGISPREASRIDPQQRLLLETTQEAFENAGIKLAHLAGRSVGVYIGISTGDYGEILSGPYEKRNVSPHSITGVSKSIAANRISYLFDFKGPSVAFDTACSSTLVALHYACAGLQSSECQVAVVGGVNALLRPETTAGFSRGGFLSAKGRCRPFDASADGYVRSEGAGTVVLKPLTKAIEDNNQIWAVIRGTYLNQDGRTEGLPYPNKQSQIEMLESTYQIAGVDPKQVAYVEAHGTGTAAGDPIEATALGTVVGADREPESPCLIGSVKSNIGHLEAGSGMAGLIKLALSLTHGMIPASLHFEKPNPRIDFEKLNLRVVNQPTPWPNGTPVRIGAVNSFGFGGTNAHVILEADANGGKIDTQSTTDQTFPMAVATLSSRTPDALKQLARKHLANDHEHIRWNDIAWSTIVHRDTYHHRAAIVAKDKAEWRQGLEALAENQQAPCLVTGSSSKRSRLSPIAFYCSGQGPQWWAMGRQLFHEDPVFRQTIEACHDRLQSHAEWSLLEEFLAPEESSRIHETQIAQPALFALQVGLANRWRSMGVEPSAVIGHSIGEVAAAVIAGALTLGQGVQIIYHRSRVQQLASGRGSMLAVALELTEAQNRIENITHQVSIAAINGPGMLTLSGDTEPLKLMGQTLDAENIFNRFLKVNVPFHSHHMEPLESDLLQSLSDISPNNSTLPLYSTVIADRVDGSELDAAYWFRNIREPVLFEAGIRKMIQHGFSTFVELSPHPILSANVTEILTQEGKEGVVVASMKRQQDETHYLVKALGQLYITGYDIDPVQTGCFVPLPNYPWQKEKFWTETSQGRNWRIGEVKHPYLATHLDSAVSSDTHIWEVKLDKQLEPYLDDHRVQGTVVFPAAGYLDMTLSAGMEITKDQFFIENINFEKALFLGDEEEPPDVRAELAGDAGTFRIMSRRKGMDVEWTRHFSCNINMRDNAPQAPQFDLAAAKKRCHQQYDVDKLYTDLRNNGLELGSAFRLMKDLRYTVCDGVVQILTRVDVPPAVAAVDHLHAAHPTVLDSLFQGALAASYIMGKSADEVGLYLPRSAERITQWRKSKGELYGFIETYSEDENRLATHCLYVDKSGRVVGQCLGLTVSFIEGSRKLSTESLYDRIYQGKWIPRDRKDQRSNRDARLLFNGIAEKIAAYDEIIPELSDQSDGQIYAKFISRLNQIALAHFWQVLMQNGVNLDSRKIVLPRQSENGHLSMTRRLLALLVQQKYLDQHGSMYRPVNQPGIEDPQSALSALHDEYPQFTSEIAVLQNSVGYVQQCIECDKEVKPWYSDDQLFSAIDRCEQEGYLNRQQQARVHSLVAQLVADQPEDRTLRMLYLSGGTGAKSAKLVDLLHPDQTDVTVAITEEALIPSLQSRFNNKRSIQVRHLQLDRQDDIDSMGEGSFDVMLLNSWQFLTDEYFDGVDKLMAGSGLMILAESPVKEPWQIAMPGYSNNGHSGIKAENAGSGPEAKKRTLPLPGFTTLYERNHIDLGLLAVTRRGHRVSGLPGFVPKYWCKQDGSALIIGNPDQLGSDLAYGLSYAGFKVSVLDDLYDTASNWDDGRYEIEVQRTVSILERTHQESPLKLLVFLGSFVLGDSDGAMDIQRVHWNSTRPAMVLIRALAAADLDSPPCTILVSCCAMPAHGTENIEPGQGSLWGLGRVMINEYANLPIRLLDISPPFDSEVIRSFILECLSLDDADEEVVLRRDRRFGFQLSRVNHVKIEEKSRIGSVPSQGLPYRLQVLEPGVLDSLRLVQAERPVPTGDQLEIRVMATGLNFRDLMVAMGMYTSDMSEGSYYGNTLGMEVSGIVERIGDNVTRFDLGDEVITSCPNAFANYVIQSQELCARKPSYASHEQAASLPVAIGTAFSCLMEIAKLQPGEKILIHSAAGGVGQMAFQLARWQGAEVYATAGTPEKRKILRSRGAKAVFDSRSLEFGTRILEMTDGDGVDVVLNSLAGKALERSIHCLAPYGRFVEIGKSDIYDDSRIGLYPFRENRSFTGFDLDKRMQQQPHRVVKTIEKFMKLLEERHLGPPEIKCFHISQVVEAFRYMAQSKHIGKVVVSANDAKPIKIAPIRNMRSILEDDKTYLITGGTSGFGMEIADWLLKKGACHIVLMSRSGPENNSAADLIHRYRDSGKQVLAISVDVSNRNELETAMAKLRKDMPPLAGIFHAAMVLDDGIIENMADEKFLNVMHPKAQGALNLHQLTRDDPISFFVMLSSIASVFGNPGQSNYAAANSFLESLAQHRKNIGLPAKTVILGVLADVGVAARNKQVSAMLSAQGWNPMPIHLALKLLERAMVDDAVQPMLIDVDWNKAAKTIPPKAAKTRFYDVLHQASRDQHGSTGHGNLRAELDQMDRHQQQDRLLKQLQIEFASILGMKADRVPVDEAITSLGMDSLMATQLGSWLDTQLRVDLPMMRILRGPSLSELTAMILDNLHSSNSDSGGGKLIFKPRPDAMMRLFCFPYLGGTAETYMPWIDELPASIELVAIKLPTDAQKEDAEIAPAHRLSGLLENIHAEISPLLDRPYGIYGHSFGAFIAFELVQFLMARGDRMPSHFFVGAMRAPQLDERSIIQERLPKQESESDGQWLTRWITEAIGFTSDASLDDPLLKFALNYRFEGPSIGCPVTALYGREEQIYSKEQVRSWCEITNESFELEEVDGPHLFIEGQTRTSVIERIANALNA